MPKFLFSYRVPQAPLAETLAGMEPASRAQRIEAWNAWLADLNGALVERGDPVGMARSVGTCDTNTRIGGYSIVTASDLEAAVALAAGCPGLAWGGGVEVGALAVIDEPAST